MSSVLLILISIILASILANLYLIREQFDLSYNSDKAIPLLDGELNLNKNLYLTENSDAWFDKILASLQINSDNIPIGAPLLIKSQKFAEKMGDIIGKYLIDNFNANLENDGSAAQVFGEKNIKYVVMSYDVEEIIYYYQHSDFSETYMKFYTSNDVIGSEKNNTNNEVCEVKSKYLISRDTKAWGVLIDINTRHYQQSLTPEIIKFKIEGKVFSDKLASVSRNIAPFMSSFSPLI